MDVAFRYKEAITKALRSSIGLVIFPMSGYNTFEASDFPDHASLFEAPRVLRSL